MALSQNKLFRSTAGAVLTVLCGLLLWGAPLGDGWVNASYDYLFRFIEKFPGTFGAKTSTVSFAKGVVLLQMDNESYRVCRQTRGKNWDRHRHAQVLNRLADDHCPLVIMDTFFQDPGEQSEDEALASALSRQQKVLLMAKASGLSLYHGTSPEEENVSPSQVPAKRKGGLEKAQQPELSVGQGAESVLPNAESVTPLLPQGVFLKAAGNNFGVAWLDPDRDFVVRRHWPFPAPGPPGLPSLPWAAARLAGAQLPSEPQEQWLRYYARDSAWTSMSYFLATNQAVNYFQDKIVFIGSKPENTIPGREEDKFSTPYTRWTNEAVGGVEILATEFLNLVNGDWLRRPAWWMEVLALIVSGIFLGGGLCRVQPRRACLLALGIALLVSLSALWLTQVSNYWVPWLIVVGGQTPCALACALVGARLRSPQEAPTSIVSPQALGVEEARVRPLTGSDLPDTDDYEIFHLLGEGSFGKVWLARNAINQWQALKAVYLARFGANRKPYEREFNGIRRYKPVSDKHPGLLRVDFVSTKKQQGYFYYVMELADALEPGWEQQPASYRPKDLAKVLARADGRRLPLEECLRISIILAEALQFLHSQSLTHGDIKPQNIIFVNGQPKLADVGLVNELPVPGQTRTGMGTPGYMPAGEPVGTPQADLYSLGMVLYVMFTGNHPESFPEIATTLVDCTRHPDFLRMNALILRACQYDRTRRYTSAKEMVEALREVRTALGSELSAKQL